MSKIIIKMDEPCTCSDLCPLSYITNYGDDLICRMQDVDPVDRYDGTDELYKGCPFKNNKEIYYDYR